MMTLKKAVTVAKGVMAIIKGKFVVVNDLATFMNIFFGTTTVTGEKVNKMLIEEEYQKLTDDIDDEDRIIEGYNADTKYTPLVKANGLYAVEDSWYDERRSEFLIWRGNILVHIFKIDFAIDSNELAKRVIAIAYYNNLINTRKESINKELLIKNIDYLKDLAENGDDLRWNIKA